VNTERFIKKEDENGLYQLCPPVNPKYVEWFITEHGLTSAQEAMAALMKDYRGVVNPSQIMEIINRSGLQ